MMLNDSKKDKLLKVLKSRGLYISLSVMVVAASVVGISAGSRAKAPSVENNNTSQISESYRENREEFHESIPPMEYTEIPDFTLPPTTQPEPETQPPLEVFGNNNEPTTENTAPVSYQLPLSGKLSKDYSMGVPVFSQTMSDYRTHNGADFAGEEGEGVKAIAEGTVTAVKKDSIWGNTVQIDHGGGITSLTCGLADEGLIGVGAKVQAESVIGVVGKIPVESADPPHIHLEVRENGALTDPLSVLGFDENTME